MIKPKISVHTLVKNEQRWIWFALMSVIDLVDEILVWDTGSTDKTVEIIKSIESPKIKFKQLSRVDADSHTEARQQMLEATVSDWILILDGDEVWWKDSLKKCLASIMEYPALDALISPFINCVGDIYHFQAPSESKYSINIYHGPYNLRFINRKIPGLHVGNPHGRQEYRDKNDVALQNFPSEKLLFVDAPYIHTTHLPRSVSRAGDKNTLKRAFKYRYELGRSFRREFIYPEPFYTTHPDLVPDPFFHRNLEFITRSLIWTPARWLKHLVIKNGTHGY